MKKFAIFLAFFLCWLISFFYVIFNIKSIDTNIYSLISENDDILSNINNNFSKDIIFLFNDFNNISIVEKYNNKYKIFSNINTGLASQYDLFINDINDLKLVSFKREDIENISSDVYLFFDNHINTLFNSFISKILPLDKDFFMISNHSALLENGGNFKYDIEKDVLYIKHDNNTYYMVQSTLNDNYNPLFLLDLVNNIKSDVENNVIISGGALFNADGHKNGVKESIYMSFLSILLTVLVFVSAFRQKSILFLMTTIVFSLTFGLATCLLVFGNIHILSIVVSASLIGLVVDFALHWLANNQNKIITSSSIKLVMKYLMINFVITAIGYCLFMFSFMVLLQQIAVISIITLFASLLYTIFFLPHILNGAYYTTGKLFNKVFNVYLVSLKYAKHYKNIILSIMVIISIFGITKLVFLSSFKDNIQNYSSINKEFLHDTILTGQIMGFKNPSNYIIIDNYSIDKEYSLINQLLNNDLINNYKGLSKTFLGNKEQIALKNIFKRAYDDNIIINMYEDVGFNKPFIDKELKKIILAPQLNINEILEKKTVVTYKYLYNENKNSGIIFFESNYNYNDLISNDKFNNILLSYDSRYYNVVDMINNYLNTVKNHAIILKIVGILLGFIILSIVFSVKQSFYITFSIVLSLLFAISLFSIFSIDINIFAVFGFILAGAVGIDYAVLMFNSKIDIKNRYFGVFISAITSMVSFVILTTSSTYSVFTFGLSVALSLFIFLYTIPLFSVDINKTQ